MLASSNCVDLTCSTCDKDKPTVVADFKTDKHLRKCLKLFILN